MKKRNFMPFFYNNFSLFTFLGLTIYVSSDKILMYTYYYYVSKGFMEDKYARKILGTVERFNC